MSGRGFDFLVEMFPKVDKTVLSEMFSNINTDEEVDRVVASLLDGVEELPGGGDHEVPQAVAAALPSDTSLPGCTSKAALEEHVHPAADLQSCGTGKCSQPLELGKYRSPACVAPIQNSYCWPTPQVPQQVDYFVGPGYVPSVQPRPAMQYSYQTPAQSPYLPQVGTPLFHNWGPSTDSVPFPVPVYTQPGGNHAAWLSGPSGNFQPMSLEGNRHSWSGFASREGRTDGRQTLHPERESLRASADADGTSRSSVAVPRIETDYDVVRHPDKCERVPQETVACRSALSETIVAYHYLALVTILPDSDHTFIRRKCEEINGSVSELQKFVLEALTLNNYEKKNCSVSAVADEALEKNSPPAALEGVSRSLHSTEEHQGTSVMHAGGDGNSEPEACAAETVSSEENASGSNILKDVATTGLASGSVDQTCTEDTDQQVEVTVSDVSSDDLCNFEMLESIDESARDEGLNVTCIVSSESEFELSLVKLEGASNENESCEVEADVQELGTYTSSWTDDKTAAAPEVVPGDVPNCGEGSSSVHQEEICVAGEASDSEWSTTDTASRDSPDVRDDDGVIFAEDDGREVDVFSSSERVVESDGESGNISAVLNAVPMLSKETVDDSERSSRQPVEFLQLAYIPEQENDDLPPDLFTVDADPSVDTTNDYEIAKMISEQDEACALVRDPLEEKINTLLNFMPEADPSYLKDICEKYGEDEAQLFALVQENLDSNKYPTFEDYLRRQETLNIIRESLNQITVPMFVSLYERPFGYFYGPRQKEESETSHELGFLQRRYRNISSEDLRAMLTKCDHNVTMCCKELDTWSGPTQLMRGDWECRVPSDIDMSFIHEVFFIENEREIREYLELESFRENVLDRAKFMEARLECPICCEDDLEIVEMAACMEGHLFCKGCVKRNAETRIGDGLTKFPCLEDSCNAEFGTRTLESLLNHTLFTRMVQQRSLEEVESAHIEDLVRCPFCEYAAILAPELIVLVCENPECMKETCRHCKEASHIPLRCNEVEKEGETKMRTEIEDRMTDALIRKCNSCGKKFVKSDGCNKMVCHCGAIMCYLCRQTVRDYTHFNGQGGTEFHKCPLFSDDNYVHREEVKKAAAHAKADVIARNPGLELKIDPTTLLP